MHLADAYPSLALSPLNIGHYSGRKKVCIYGAGLGKSQAPLEDPEWDVWTCNLVAPLDVEGKLRADLWFDLHQRCAQTPDDLRWIAACPVPIYLPPDLMDASENATRYPLEEIEQRFRVNYWACTFAYQIALALHMGHYTDIGLYGVELAWGTVRERTVEWANTAFWLGMAHARDVNIHTPIGSTLGAHVARYGFEYDEEIRRVKNYEALLRQRREPE